VDGWSKSGRPGSDRQNILLDERLLSGFQKPRWAEFSRIGVRDDEVESQGFFLTLRQPRTGDQHKGTLHAIAGPTPNYPGRQRRHAYQLLRASWRQQQPMPPTQFVLNGTTKDRVRLRHFWGPGQRPARSGCPRRMWGTEKSGGVNNNKPPKSKRQPTVFTADGTIGTRSPALINPGLAPKRPERPFAGRGQDAIFRRGKPLASAGLFGR